MNIVSFDFRSAYDVPIPRPIVKQPKPPRQPRQPKEKTSTENSTYYSRNKERIRQYYLNNSEVRRAYNKKYYLNNAEELNLKMKQYYITNKAYFEQYRRKHYTKYREYFQEYYLRNK